MASDKNKMIGELLKFYKVQNVNVQYKSMKDFAHYDVDDGVLELSSRYKEIRKSDIQDFLITMIHEIYHAMDAKKYGISKFKKKYEMEIAQWQAENPNKNPDRWYKHIRSEVEAEKFGQRNYRRWLQKFKKKGYIK